MGRAEDGAGAGLVGALVERVDRPAPGLFVLTLSLRGRREALALAAGPPRPAPAWAILAERPRGEAADGAVRGLRDKLEAGRVVRIRSTTGGGLAISVQRSEMLWDIETTMRGFAVSPGNLPAARGPDGSLNDDAIDHARARGAGFVREHALHATQYARDEAVASIRRAHARLSRRADAVGDDVAKAEDAERRAREAAVFVPLAARAQKGATRLVATDWSSGEPREVEMTLDPAKSAREQIDVVFARAKRLRNGAVIAQRRREETLAAMRALDAAATGLDEASTADEIAALVRALGRTLPRDVKLSARAPVERPKAGVPPVRRPYREYASEAGTRILVGRDALSNDELTMRIARPGDMWLHAKGVEGAHVIARGAYKQPGGGPDGRVLLDAAALAAHFSAARDEPIVEVAYVDRRHVRKPRGSAAGAVRYQNEHVLALRQEPARLARLLETCDRAADDLLPSKR